MKSMENSQKPYRNQPGARGEKAGLMPGRESGVLGGFVAGGVAAFETVWQAFSAKSVRTASGRRERRLARAQGNRRVFPICPVRPTLPAFLHLFDQHDALHGADGLGDLGGDGVGLG